MTARILLEMCDEDALLLDCMSPSMVTSFIVICTIRAESCVLPVRLLDILHRTKWNDAQRLSIQVPLNQ